MTIKLSETQDSAIREVAELGYTVAKANTIKSLEGKGLIKPVGNTHHELTTQGREYLGLPAEELHQDEPLADWERELLQADTFDNSMGDAMKANMGFAITLDWNKTKVWHGLTADQIREDIETARPIGRKGRRQYSKIQQKAATAVRMALRELAAA